MAARRGAINVRLPAQWLDHLVRHGSKQVEGGYVWKVDPVSSSGLPGSFSLDHLRAQHARITCPVLVLTGSEHDTWSDLSDDELAGRLSHLRDVRHQVIEGAGHYVHIEQPDAVLAAITGFMAELDGPARLGATAEVG